MSSELKAVAGKVDALPKPIADLVVASSRNSMDGFLACWADDALLVDSHRRFWGKEAIRRWSSIEWVGDNVAFLEIRDVEERADGNWVVHAVLEGVYDKEGLPDDYVCAFFFKLRGDRIVRLIILPYKGRRLGKMTQTRMASTCFSAMMPNLA